jgi:type 1 fimbria pilin
MVVCPAPKVSLRKETNIPRLKAALGDKFSDLFEEVTTVRPRKDFQELVKDCTQDEMQVVLTAVDLVADTPRVAFKD